MPDIDHDPQPVALPAGLEPDPFTQAARKVATAPAVSVVFETDARRIADQLVRQATKLTIDELDRVGAEIVQLNEDLELWGALDYELLLLAERFGVTVEPDDSPLDVVKCLMSAAWYRGTWGDPCWPSSSTVVEGFEGENA